MDEDWKHPPFHSFFLVMDHTVDGSEIPNNHLGWCWNLVHNGINHILYNWLLSGFLPSTVCFFVLAEQCQHLGKIMPDYCFLQSAIGSVKWWAKEGSAMTNYSRCSIWKYSNTTHMRRNLASGWNTNPIKGILYLGSFVSFTKWLVDPKFWYIFYIHVCGGLQSASTDNFAIKFVSTLHCV